MNRPVEATDQDGWDNLPPHLSEALREAMEGLSDAYLDVSHPLSPQLQALWDVTDQIEAWLLAQHEPEKPRLEKLMKESSIWTE
jgi:hypothetical protein